MEKKGRGECERDGERKGMRSSKSRLKEKSRGRGREMVKERYMYARM